MKNSFLSVYLHREFVYVLTEGEIILRERERGREGETSNVHVFVSDCFVMNSIWGEVEMELTYSLRTISVGISLCLRASEI